MSIMLFSVFAAWLGGFLCGLVAFGLAGMYYHAYLKRLPQMKEIGYNEDA